MLYNTFHSSSLFLLTASCWHTIYLLCATLFMLHSLIIHFIYIFFPVHSLAGHFMCLLCGSFSCPPFHLSSVWFIPLGTLDPHFNYLLCSSCSYAPFYLSSWQFIFLLSILSIFFAVHSLDLHFFLQSYFFCSDDMLTACDHDPVFF
jgi:hypothetical protein